MQAHVRSEVSGKRGTGGDNARSVSGGCGTTGRLRGNAIRVRGGGGTAGRGGRAIGHGMQEGVQSNVGHFIFGIRALLPFESC